MMSDQAMLFDAVCRAQAVEILTLGFLADSLANDPAAMQRLGRVRTRTLDRLPASEPGSAPQAIKDMLERYLAHLERAAHPPIAGQAQT